MNAVLPKKIGSFRFDIPAADTITRLCDSVGGGREGEGLYKVDESSSLSQVSPGWRAVFLNN